MAETTKKFLDFTGLQQYDKLLKDKIAADIKAVQDDLNTRKVKDTANSDTITWSKAENGTYTASVKGVVLDNDDYVAVKTKATQSAAAWTKFLNGSNVAYPDGITPELKDLATKTETSDALASAKSYADGLAKNYDKVGAATQALNDAKTYADGLVKDAEGNVKFDAKGSAEAAKTAAIKAAKEYADGAFDTKGSAEAAKTAAISAAKTYTDTEIVKVNDAISSINTAIAGGVHFIGISTTTITDKGIEKPTIDGIEVSKVNKGDIVINNAGAEFIWDGSKWQKLGDTTAEQERLTNLEGHVNTLRGDENTAGSVAKALKDAKTYTDGAIDTLVNNGQVKTNTEAIAVLNGGETTPGSVAKALKDAKGYADGVGSAAQSHTDTKIAELVGSTGQVGKNTAAIATLNADAQTEGSVDYKIAQAVSNIEASIDTIPNADIEKLFTK